MATITVGTAGERRGQAARSTRMWFASHARSVTTGISRLVAAARRIEPRGARLGAGVDDLIRHDQLPRI